MQNAFYGCQAIEHLPKNLDTSNSTNFASFCRGCILLKDIPWIDTSKGTTFEYFAAACESLKTIPLIDTSKGTNFNYFLYNSTSISSVPNIDTRLGTSFNYFCGNLIELRRLPDISTPSATSMQFFAYHTGILELPTTLITDNVTNFTSFCQGCQYLLFVPDNVVIGPKCTTLESAFNGCVRLEHFTNNITTENVKSFKNFCYSCYTLKELPSTISTSQCTLFEGFLRTCYYLKKLDFTIDLRKTTANVALCLDSYSLRHIKVILSPNYNCQMNSLGNLSIESLKFLSDNAPTLTSTKTLQLGSTLISRANSEDPTIITTLQSKGWTVT